MSSHDEKKKLVKYLKKVDPSRVEEADQILEHYAGNSGKMWKTLEKKYGVEHHIGGGGDSNDAASKKQQRDKENASKDKKHDKGGKHGHSVASPGAEVPNTSSTNVAEQRIMLRDFYRQFAPEKGDQEVEESIVKYSDPNNGGFEKMWKILRKKYMPPSQGGEGGGGDGKKDKSKSKEKSAHNSKENNKKDPHHSSSNNVNNEKEQSVIPAAHLQQFPTAPDQPQGQDFVSKHLSASEEARQANNNHQQPKYSSLGGGLGKPPMAPERVGGGSKEFGQPQQPVPPGPSTEEKMASFFASEVVDSNSPKRGSVEDTKNRLLRFYLHYAPERIIEVDQLLQYYGGDKNGGFSKMWLKLNSQFGPEPAPLPSAPASTSLRHPENDEEGLGFGSYRSVTNSVDAHQTTKKSKANNDEAEDEIATNENNSDRHPQKLIHREYTTEETKLWKDRVRKFYDYYAPEKTDDEIELALSHYSPPHGYERMWAQLLKKYGAEPVDAMSGLVKRYLPEKTDAGLAPTNDAAMRFGGSGGIFEDNKKKASPPQLISPKTGHHLVDEDFQSEISDLSPLSNAMDTATPSPHLGTGLAAQHVPSVVVHALIRFQGCSIQFYEKASQDHRDAFKRAIEFEVAVNLGIHKSQVQVTKLAAGIVCELDVELTQDQVQTGVGEQLVTKILLGTFTVPTIRDAYRKELGGNPMQLHTEGAAIFGGSCTPHFQNDVAASPEELESLSLAPTDIGKWPPQRQGEYENSGLTPIVTAFHRYERSFQRQGQPQQQAGEQIISGVGPDGAPILGSSDVTGGRAYSSPRSGGTSIVSSSPESPSPQAGPRVHLQKQQTIYANPQQRLISPLRLWTTNIPETNEGDEFTEAHQRHESEVKAALDPMRMQNSNKRRTTPSPPNRTGFPNEAVSVLSRKPAPMVNSWQTGGHSATNGNSMAVHPATSSSATDYSYNNQQQVRNTSPRPREYYRTSNSLLESNQRNVFGAFGGSSTGGGSSGFLSKLWEEGKVNMQPPYEHAVDPSRLPTGGNQYEVSHHHQKNREAVENDSIIPPAIHSPRTNIPPQDRKSVLFRETHKPFVLNHTPSTDNTYMPTRTAAPTLTEFPKEAVEQQHTSYSTFHKQDQARKADLHVSELLHAIHSPRDYHFQHGPASTENFSQRVRQNPGTTMVSAVVGGPDGPQPTRAGYDQYSNFPYGEANGKMTTNLSRFAPASTSNGCYGDQWVQKQKEVALQDPRILEPYEHSMAGQKASSGQTVHTTQPPRTNPYYMPAEANLAKRPVGSFGSSTGTDVNKFFDNSHKLPSGVHSHGERVGRGQQPASTTTQEAVVPSQPQYLFEILEALNK